MENQNTPLNLTEDEAAIQKDRGSFYGPADKNFSALGHMIQGLLEAHYQQPLPGPIPAHVVGHIYVASKMVRAVVPYKFNEDNYVDGKVYMELAKVSDPRWDEVKKDKL